ncbi:MAG: hypothetical protein WCH98_07065 [Verrucomicrobiota bacterium]
MNFLLVRELALRTPAAGQNQLALRLASAVADPLCWGVVAALPRLLKRASRETITNTARDCRGYR